jgi:hypothetical protein
MAEFHDRLLEDSYEVLFKYQPSPAVKGRAVARIVRLRQAARRNKKFG